jgi:hypothetical protein
VSVLTSFLYVTRWTVADSVNPNEFSSYASGWSGTDSVNPN